MSAMIPPSPSLSARITKVTYLTETMIMTAQNTSEMTPYTPAWSGRTAPEEKTASSA
ncbi:MAG: hypothetical protein WKF31_11950 [Thermoleophilaceae bacterium]